MITIKYSYECDWCKKPVHDDEEYKIMPHMPARDMSIPMPRINNQLGYGHVCDLCLCVALDAVRKHHEFP